MGSIPMVTALPLPQPCATVRWAFRRLARMAQNDSTSWSIILGAAARRPADQERFARLYTPMIKAYLAARWRVPVEHEDVGDASQEVLLQCFRQHGALDSVEPGHESGFRAFLYGVTRNVAAMTERKWARTRESQASHSAVFERVDDDLSLSHVFDRAWAEVIVREARALLQRRALMRGGTAVLRARALELRYQGALPPREIAPRLGLEVKQVYRLLEDGQVDFQEALLDVMALQVPSASRTELESKCSELLMLLEG
jgi:RNA polymerase sigma-70 factor (ECF subfamily)